MRSSSRFLRTAANSCRDFAEGKEKEKRKLKYYNDLFLLFLGTRHFLSRWQIPKHHRGPPWAGSGYLLKTIINLNIWQDCLSPIQVLLFSEHTSRGALQPACPSIFTLLMVSAPVLKRRELMLMCRLSMQVRTLTFYCSCSRVVPTYEQQPSPFHT